MSNFQPTLRIEFTREELNALDENPSVQYKMFDFNSNGKRFPQFTADKITVIKTGEVLEDFVADVVSSFNLAGVKHIQTAGGDIIPLKAFLGE